jgi:hypothetical protein
MRDEEHNSGTVWGRIWENDNMEMVGVSGNKKGGGGANVGEM